MRKITFFLLVFLFLLGTLSAYSQPISDLNADVKYPKNIYLNNPEEIEVNVKNVGELPVSRVSVIFDVPLGGPMITLREKNGPEVLQPSDSMKFVFDIIGKNKGEYAVKVKWDWRESEHATRGKEDTLSISIQEPPVAFNLGWVLVIGGVAVAVGYNVYHARRKMRQMEQETDGTRDRCRAESR